jgi:hypothetical protein
MDRLKKAPETACIASEKITQSARLYDSGQLMEILTRGKLGAAVRCSHKNGHPKRTRERQPSGSHRHALTDTRWLVITGMMLDPVVLPRPTSSRR